MKKMIKRQCPPSQREEAWSEVCYRAPDIVKNYDPGKGASVTTHFMRCAWGYVYKMLRRDQAPKADWDGVASQRPSLKHVADVPEGSASECLDVGSVETLVDLGEALDPFDLWLLERCAVDGYNYSEVAEVLGAQPHQVSAWYRAALSRARDVLAQGGE